MIRSSCYPRFAAAACAAVVVCACVGDGVAPERISFEPVFGFIPTEFQRLNAVQRFEEEGVFTMLECMPVAPTETRLTMFFDSGRVENITARSPNVRYSSSDESVVRISNGEEGDFPSGTIVPGSPGTATVTAEFVGLATEMDVRVFPITDVEGFVDFPEFIAPNSVAEVRVTARFGGQTFDDAVSSMLVNVRNVGEDEDDEGPIYSRVERTQSGLAFVRGIVPGGPAQIVETRFTECDKGNFSKEYQVEPVEELRVEREFDAAQWLPVGFTEELKATAVFHGGAEQDVTNSVAFREPGLGEEDPPFLFFPGNPVGNRVVLGVPGVLPGEEENEESANGGVTAVSARLEQFNEAVCESIAEERRPQLPAGFAECDAEALEDALPEVDGNQVPVEVRRGRAVEPFAWDLSSLDESIVDNGTLLLPRGCSIQPDVISAIELLAEDGELVTQTRRINRETSFFVGPEPPDEEEEENGENGEEEETEEEPVLQVVQRDGTSTQLNAGLITAVGGAGAEEIVRALRTSPVSLEDESDEEEDPETITLESVLDVRIVPREGIDCTEWPE